MIDRCIGTPLDIPPLSLSLSFSLQSSLQDFMWTPGTDFQIWVNNFQIRFALEFYCFTLGDVERENRFDVSV